MRRPARPTCSASASACTGRSASWSGSAPGDDEWDELDAEHRRLSNAQSLIDAARLALGAVSEGEPAADALTGQAIDALESAASIDPRLGDVVEALRGAQAQLQDAAHELSSYLHHTEPEPDRLQAIDERLSAWVALARRYRRPPQELPALLAQWQGERQALDAAGDLDALRQALRQARARFDSEARQASDRRAGPAPQLAQAITDSMQQLGMAGGRFDVALIAQEQPQSFGLESAEFLVAGHAGSTPRPLAKVASGGELSRIALAVAVTTSKARAATRMASSRPQGTLIFDEIDAGVGGAVAESVGRLMKQLGQERQVLAVTHLPQVAACADHHFLVSKQSIDGRTASDVTPIDSEPALRRSPACSAAIGSPTPAWRMRGRCWSSARSVRSAPWKARRCRTDRRVRAPGGRLRPCSP